MKKNFNFVVPHGYVGYSGKSGRVFQAGKWINPLTVVLVDISKHVEEGTGTHRDVGTCRDTYLRHTINLDYAVSFSPIEENMADFCEFKKDKFMEYVDKCVGDISRPYFFDPYPYYLKGDAKSLYALMSPELRDIIDKEVTEKIKESYPYLNVVFRITDMRLFV